MKRFFLFLLALLILVPAAVLGLQLLHDPGAGTPGVAVADAGAQIRQGSYLAKAANCMACHTTRGGAEYAGGRRIATPFGDLYSPNITPDLATGIGKWTADDFWRSLHNGKSRDGRFLYPAFPYTEYTKMTRADSDAMFAYFRTLTPVAQPNREHAMRFPFDQRLLLAGWRALYFQPGEYQPRPDQTAQWNRGAYLVQGAGHCSACHAERNALGATQAGSALAGGLIPVLGWYAPSLTSNAEAGLGEWEVQQVVSLLKTGVSPRATVFGPMAEVVQKSLQHLSNADLTAMAVYLKALPQTAAEASDAASTASANAARKSVEKAATPDKTAGQDPVPAQAPGRVNPGQEAVIARGARLYGDHCVACHKENGRGVPAVYPPLAGNRAVTMDASVNAIRIVLNGGFAPGTAGNPRPHGMPPYGPFMGDAEVAAVVSFIRNAWGNEATTVTAEQVSRYRAVPID